MRSLVSTIVTLCAVAPCSSSYQETYELDVRTWEKSQAGWVLLQFYAPWCQHCKKLRPVYEKLANHYHREVPPRLTVAKVDHTAHPGLVDPFDVKAYPTLLMLRDGKHIATFTGKRTYEGIAAFADDTLAGREHVPLASDKPLQRPRRGLASIPKRLEAKVRSWYALRVTVQPVYHS